jgi:hypothetical protein
MIDQTDRAITEMMDDLHRRLKNAAGVKSLGYRDFAKPSLNYSPGEPLKITSPRAWPKKLRIARPS